jgi:hypothetical protein
MHLPGGGLVTVSDLIRELRDLPGDLDVMADDFENGRYGVTGAEVDDYYGTLPRHVVIK